MEFQKAFEMKYSADELRGFIDSSPTLTWCCSSDGSADFFNQRWLDYTGLSAEQARDWGWTVALHSDDLSGLVDYRRSVLASVVLKSQSQRTAFLESPTYLPVPHSEAIPILMTPRVLPLL